MRTFRYWLAGFFSLLCALSLTGAGLAFSPGSAGAAAPSGTPIKIGYLMQNSGPSDANEAPVFAAWAKWVDAHGGVDGHPVQLTTDVDPGNVAIAVTDAQKLIGQGVTALIDADGNDAAWAQIAEKAGVPVFLSTNTIAFGSSDDAFGPAQNPTQTPTQEMLAARKVGSTKFALLYCTEYSQCSEAIPYFKAVGAKEGVDLVYSAAVSEAAPNYLAQCLAAKAAGATSMLVASTSDVAQKVASDCVKQGYSPHLIAATGSFQQSFAGSPGTNGAIIAEGNTPFFDTSSPAIKSMRTILSQYDPSILKSPNLNDVTVWNWAIGTILAEAVKAGNLTATTQVTPAALRTALFTLHTTTAGGLITPITMTQGQQETNHCYYFAAIKNGKFVLPYGLTLNCLVAST